MIKSIIFKEQLNLIEENKKTDYKELNLKLKPSIEKTKLKILRCRKTHAEGSKDKRVN